MLNYISFFLNFFQLLFFILKESIWYCFHKQDNKLIKNIVFEVSKKNILSIKLFQSLAFNQKWFHESFLRNIQHFIDQVPYTKEDIDIEVLNCTKTLEKYLAEKSESEKQL